MNQADEDIERNRESLVDMARMFMRGKVLCAAVRLGIPDALEDGKLSLRELATATNSNTESLHRLMRVLAGIGVVKEVEPPFSFELTTFGAPLRRNASDSVWASVVFWSDLIADSWTYLPECVRDGGDGGAAGAMEGLGIKSRWSMEPEAQALFHAVFSEPTSDDMACFVEAYDFSGCRVIADLGGAGGGLLAAILPANPQMRGILVDRREAIDRAAAELADGLVDRCQLVVGDLLETVPSGADAYLLKNVLHGYDDGSARRILENCHAAMQPESRLLIIETVLPDKIAPTDPRVEEMMMSDLNMLAVTGGRERTAIEWAGLLSSAGLELQRVAAVGDSISSIIEAGSTNAES